MRISKGDKVDGKVVDKVGQARQYAGELFRSVSFEDGTFGVLHISNGVVRILNDPKLNGALCRSVEIPVVEVSDGGEKLLIHTKDSNGGCRLELQY